MTAVANFLSKQTNYIWTTSALHRKESIAKMQVFLDYDNNAEKRVDKIRHDICNGYKAAVFHCTRHTAATVMGK